MGQVVIVVLGVILVLYATWSLGVRAKSGDRSLRSLWQAHEPAIPASAASASLNLGAATIRSSAAASRGVVSRMAEASGQEISSIHASPLEQFGSGVARAGKSDCLAPNEYGSLLSIPIVAYGALAGNCK